MMTPEAKNAVLEEVRQMLARATPEQAKQLMSDILNSAPFEKGTAKYDA